MNLMDTESLLAKLVATALVILVLSVGAYAAGYIVGSVQAREPSTQQKIMKYLEKHYPDYIRRLK